MPGSLDSILVAMSSFRERHVRPVASVTSNPGFRQRAEVTSTCSICTTLVTRQILASRAQQLQWRHSVARQQIVQVGRDGVSGTTGVEDDGRAAGARQNQRGGETCWSAADNRDVAVE